MNVEKFFPSYCWPILSPPTLALVVSSVGVVELDDPLFDRGENFGGGGEVEYASKVR